MTVSTVELSLAFLITTEPAAPLRMFSLNVITRLAFRATPVALSAGDSVLTVGAVKSPVVKFHAVAPLIPPKLFPAKSWNIPLATST